jgi:prepilin-type N-terminal cleavage/methylation domain-containing protein
MKAQSGFTLVELMVVVALIAIILAMVTLSFTQLNDKYTVESNIKELYSLLMRARNEAATTNIPRFVRLNTNLVQAGSDMNNNNILDVGEIDITIPYPRFTINCAINPLAACAGNMVVFDTRGLTNNNQTLSITGFSGGSTPAMDCIAIAATRINIGIMTGPGPGENCVLR